MPSDLTVPHSTDHEAALERLTDAMELDIMALTDEEVAAEAAEDGVDLDTQAARMRAMFERLVRERANG